MSEAPDSPDKKGGLAARRSRAGLAIQSLHQKSANLPRIKRLDEGQGIESLYNIQEKVQELENRSVFTCTDVKTEKQCVLKIRVKKTDDRAFRAITERMLRMPRMKNILHFEAVFEDDSNYYMVMERCNGGELFSLLMTEDAISERECKRIIREILMAVDGLHEQGLLHRDIKPENLLMHQAPADPNDPLSPPDAASPKVIKLIDFDTSWKIDPSTPKSKSVVGTHGYIAPESYRGEYTPSSDLWSVGVIFYVLMTGDMPFENALFDKAEDHDNTVGRGIERMHDVLKDQQIDWECPPWPDFPLARDLCKKLLCFEPEARSPSAKDALQHVWLQS